MFFLVLTLQIAFVPEALLLLLFMWVLTYIQTWQLRRSSFPLKAYFPSSARLYYSLRMLFTFLGIDRVYFLGQKL